MITMSEKTVWFNANGRYADLEDMKWDEKLKKHLSYYVPGFKFIATYRYGSWDGKISMIKRGRVNLGLLRGMKDELKEEGLVVKLRKWMNRPKVKITEGFVEKDEKYAYQNECVDKMLDSIQWGGGLVLSATGTGKTKMAAQFMSHLDCHVLFVVDQLDLLYQSKKEIEMWLKQGTGKDVRVGLVGDSEFKPDWITVATVQTLQKHSEKKSHKFKEFMAWFKKIDVVLIDELHVQMSKRNFDVLDKIKPQAVFGLTATMQMQRKEIKLKAFGICGPVIYSYPIEDGVGQGVLSKGVVLQLQMQSQLHTDDYDQAVVHNDDINEEVAKLIKLALSKDYAVVLLVERLDHLFNMCQLLKDENPMVCAGAIKVAERQRNIRKFEHRHGNLIIATKVFKKGINIKRVDMIIDAAQMRNKNDAIQKFGRGVRLHREKDGLIYFDIHSTDGVQDSKIKKAASSRYNALKKQQIPIRKVFYDNATQTLELAEKMLKAV